MLVSSGQNACAQITAASCLSRVVKAPVLKLRPFISLVLCVPRDKYLEGRLAKFESLQGYITAAHAFETNVEIRIAGSAGRPQKCRQRDLKMLGCFVINLLNDKTIILLNLSEYRMILADSASGLVG